MSDPDHDLVSRARKGEFEAFRELLEKYQARLYTWALRIVRQEEDAQDVVQETFLSVIEHLAEFRGESTFHTWLIRIATNRALNLLRKRRSLSTVSVEDDREEGRVPHPEFVAPWRDRPERIAEDAETQRVLSEALLGLNEKHRLVFLLRDVEGLSTRETAQTLGISEGNVRVRLNRARLHLRERLTRAFGVSPGPSYTQKAGSPS